MFKSILKIIFHPLFLFIYLIVLITIFEVNVEKTNTPTIPNTIMFRKHSVYVLDNGMDVYRYMDEKPKYLGWKITDYKDTFEIVGYRKGQWYVCNGMIIDENEIKFYNLIR
ncbi:MAG: hypothetical protein [Wendovervirus sonii]|uniref:Uncharacterized protein n=1 Tax=phage Lak_Megaphage_Sonny TaxID=3109229 RepID=A0ABZ0Z3D1_9CAUD|nr:MAG: hypothetical protein [phage Lak_Megaphage_Sonny]